MEFLTIPEHTMCHAFIHAGSQMECFTPFPWQIHSITQQIFAECLMCRHYKGLENQRKTRQPASLAGVRDRQINQYESLG